MKNKFIISVIILCFSMTAFAQKDEAFGARVRNLTNFNEIMRVVKTHYKDPAVVQRLGKETIRKALKRWNRWEWYMSSRVNSDGELMNISEKMTEQGLQRGIGGAAQRTQSNGGNWALMGPLTTPSGIGRADRMAFHPSDPNIIFAGTSGGGLWKTINGGTTWTCLTNDIPSLGVSGIAIHPFNPNIIYILTGDGDSDFGGLVDGFGYMHTSIGVLKTTNGGTTWVKTGTFPGSLDALNGFQLVMDPNNAEVLLAATNKGLFRTFNGGFSWTEVINELCYDVIYKPGSSLTCYAVTRVGNTAHFYRSLDGGITWNPTSNTDAVIAARGRCKLAVTPANNAWVYILAGGSPDTGRFAGIHRSTTSGAGFATMALTPNILGGSSTGDDIKDQSGYDLSLAVSLLDETKLVSGAVNIWRSSGSGITGTWVYEGGTHADIHDLQYNPLDNKLWAATDGGPYYSTDDGVTWTAAYGSLSVSQFYHLAVRPDDFSQILAGAQDNGVKYRANSSSHFDHIKSNDGYFVAFDAADNSIFYSILNSDVFKFTSNGSSNSKISPEGLALNEFFPTMAVHTSTGNTLWVASDSVWRTTDAGVSWTATPDIPGAWYFKSCKSNGNRLYLAGGNTANDMDVKILRRSDDGGLTWPAGNILSANPGFPPNFPKITCINTDPTNSGRVWITFGGFQDGIKVLYSSNFGATWTNVSGSLPNLPVNCIELDNSNNAYIGTDHGVYYRGASMNDWVPFYNNLPYTIVTDLSLSESENRIRASTFGRGIWSSDLYSSCPASQHITGLLEGQEFYEASGLVSSTATLAASEGTKVEMRSATNVALTPGFIAPANSKLRVSIAPCGTGITDETFRVTNSMQWNVKKMVKPAIGYAAVEVTNTGTTKATFNLHVNKPGTVHVVVSTGEGTEIMRSAPQTYSSKQTISQQLSLPSLKPGMYYIHVVHDNRWVHFQELDIK
jgi:hypothetical protein